MKRSFTINYFLKVKVTVGVIIALFLLSAFVSYHIRQIEEEAAWFSLKRSANRLNEELTRRIDIDREVLLTLADMINKQESLDGPEVRKIVTEFQADTLMAYVGLLLPGDKLILPNRPVMDVRGRLSFEAEKAQGIHISDRVESLMVEDYYILRNFVPIERDGEVVAMLYGVMNIDTLPVLTNSDLHEGEAAYVILDGKTSDFLLNTQRQKLGNMWDVPEREVKSGDPEPVMRAKLRDGQEGHNILKSSVSGEYACFYYKPASINEWRVGIIVPEDIALARVNRTERVLLVFLLGEFVLLASYFLWLERTSRKELAEQKRLAERDLLTGCWNRNYYENQVARLDQEGTHVSCIYMDVNGLHELNNTKGHAAGDAMLKTLAALTKAKFGEDGVYRIGGDEFVVLVEDAEEARMDEDLRALLREIHAEGYFVSVGASHRRDDMSMNEMIKLAEVQMYAAKRDFYDEQGCDISCRREARALPSGSC